MGAGLRSCGNALSTEEIWGSDSRLVFLLHNQFAVWIPSHKTRNTNSPLDPAQSLTSFLHPPISLHLFFTCSHLCFSFRTLRFQIDVTRNKSHMMLSRNHFCFILFVSDLSRLLRFLPPTMVKSAPTALLDNMD